MISILHAAGYVLTKSAVPSLSPFIGVQNCSGFPGSIYVSRCSTCDFRRYVKWRQQAYSPHSVPSTQALDFPLPVARSENRGQKIYLQTHESSSIPEILFGTTTDFFFFFFGASLLCRGRTCLCYTLLAVSSGTKVLVVGGSSLINVERTCSIRTAVS